jgi:hypothetical protein
MSEHTPGPWLKRPARIPDNVGGYDVGIVGQIGERDYIIAEAFEIVDKGVKVPVNANARLIAAAPDLLAALKRLLYAPDNELSEANDQARAAIDKAEGRS